MITTVFFDDLLQNEIQDDNIEEISHKIELLLPNDELQAYKILQKKYDRKIVNKIKTQVNLIKVNKKDIYFKELFYCLYYKKSFKHCLYTIISSAIHNRIACISDNSFHIEGVFFPRSVTRCFNGLKTDSSNSITYEFLNDLHLFFQSELINKGFIYKIPIIGNCYSRQFKNYIKNIENNVNEHIKAYIHTNNINELKKINPQILEIKFTASVSKKFKSFYLDSLDAYSAYRSAKYGNPRKYNSYYSISGQKIPIE